MKRFTHVNASSIEEAVSWLERYGKKGSVGNDYCQEKGIALENKSQRC